MIEGAIHESESPIGKSLASSLRFILSAFDLGSSINACAARLVSGQRRIDSVA